MFNTTRFINETRVIPDDHHTANGKSNAANRRTNTHINNMCNIDNDASTPLRSQPMKNIPWARIVVNADFRPAAIQWFYLSILCRSLAAPCLQLSWFRRLERQRADPNDQASALSDVWTPLLPSAVL